MNIIVFHTSTHDPKQSSSSILGVMGTQALLSMAPGSTAKFVDVAKLHVAENLSCYAGGKLNCADPKAGPYRCWANVNDPTDQMPVVYDGLKWADTVIVTTSVRWGSHTAVLQRMIERMNTLENRGSVYKEPFPMAGKKLGIVVTGMNWRTGKVATDLLDTLRWWGFATQQGDHQNVLAWQRSYDIAYEHPDNDRPYVHHWAQSPAGIREINRWAHAVLNSSWVANG